MPSPKNHHPATRLPAFDPESGDLNAVVETIKGSRNKFAYDEQLALFRLKGVLPAGASFPFDFGFVPSTLGEDGDPLDVLVLMDEPAFAGCLVPARLVGVITAEQREESGEVEQNDRLIAVASGSRTHEGVQRLEDLSSNLLGEIEYFFVSYNTARDRTFTPKGRKGAQEARKIVEAGVALHARRSRNAPKRKEPKTKAPRRR
jgi:inorganic pyrophosphatase